MLSCEDVLASSVQSALPRHSVMLGHRVAGAFALASANAVAVVEEHGS